MNEQIEIEYKILISEDTFQTILQDNQPLIKKDYLQTNYYFTHPLLSQKGWMLRIREKEYQLEMTLKRPYQGHRLETNVEITQADKNHFLNHQDLDNDIIKILKKEGIDPSTLQQPFSLTTHRYDIPLSEGLLSLDENTYLDQKDYELEFEVYDEEKGFRQFQQLINKYQLQYQRNCPSKIQRVKMRAAMHKIK